MKNRLIIALISLMVVSLVGIISIQHLWITGAIADRETEFATHINDALNRVNESIDKDEAEFILKEEFGGMDSVVQDVFFMDNEDGHHDQRIEIRFDEKASDFSDTMHERMIMIHSSDSTNQENDALTVTINEWHEKLDLKLQEIDSTLSAVEKQHLIHDKHMNQINTMVKHYSFEMLLGDDLEDRISPNELKEKLAAALKKEGIYQPFDFAVKNNKSGDFEKGYRSAGFDQKDLSSGVSKKLFQNDRMKNAGFELFVQVNNKGGYIWEGVWRMTILSILFTLLIILSFSYAIYFIYKQKKISQIKNDFINNMTHELKTPLASISLAASSIKHPQVIHNEAEIKRFAEIIESEKQRMNLHIERVLDMAALDSGDLKLNISVTSLATILNTALKNIDLSLNETGGKATFNCELSDTTVKGDEFHLINVFTNLLDNSIKYRNTKELEIDVNLQKEGETYVISISDNGIGMSSREQKLAFDKFYRAQSGNIHDSKGFGLGLSYVKTIVEKHHGSVSLKSEPDKGTTVVVRIPITHE